MEMRIQNGERYENNFARAAAYHLGTCAKQPEDAAELAAYRLITGIYQTVYEHGERIGFHPVADVSFAPWEQQYDRQKDVKTIRSTIDKVESLMAGLYALVDNGEVCPEGLRLSETARKPGRTLLKALAENGCTMEGDTLFLPAGCAAGLKALVEISRAHTIPITDGPKADKEYLYFSRAVFDPSKNWTASAFDRLLAADGQLIRLCDELERRGYTRIDCKDGKRISLDYVKQYGRKKEPVKASWANKTYAGIEVTYEDLRLEPCFVWLRIPMFSTVLARIGTLPEGAADFIFRNTKTCNGCRYCVQTDRTGTRPLAAIDINGTAKCPYFAAFSMNWRALPQDLARNILAVIDAVDELDL